MFVCPHVAHLQSLSCFTPLRTVPGFVRSLIRCIGSAVHCVINGQRLAFTLVPQCPWLHPVSVSFAEHSSILHFRELPAVIYIPIYWVIITCNPVCSSLSAIGGIFSICFVHTDALLPPFSTLAHNILLLWNIQKFTPQDYIKVFNCISLSDV